MRSCLGFFVFLFVFLPLTFCGLLTGAVSTWLFDRSFYVDLFSAEGLYAAFVGDNLELGRALELGDGTLPPETANAFGQAIQASVTPTYIRDEIVRNINAMFDYFEDFSRGLTLTWDLRPIKRNLSDQQISAFADVLVRTLPPCAPNAPPADSLLPTCRPPNQSLEELTAQVRERLPRFIANLPDFQPIGDPISPNMQNGALLGGTVQALITSGALSLLIGALFAWLFVGVLSARSTKGLWAVLGITLLVAALPVLLIGVAITTGLGSNVISEQIGSVLVDQAGLQSSQALRDATLSAVQGATTRIANGFLLYGGGATAIAVVLVLLSAIIPPPRKRNDIASSDVISPLR